MKTYLIGMLIATASFTACNKNTSSENDAPLSGKWVRADLITDTLDFNSFMSPGAETSLFTLKRQYKLNNSGARQPVEKEGPYSYELLGDQIKIQWLLSSCMGCTSPYHFSKNGKTLQIGNFIDQNSEVLTFRKI